MRVGEPVLECYALNERFVDLVAVDDVSFRVGEGETYGLVEHGAGVVDVLPQVGVLLGFAAVTVTLATWRLRRAVTG
jgi:ABC-type Na+ transport system ATPase subunit NatA